MNRRSFLGSLALPKKRPFWLRIAFGISIAVMATLPIHGSLWLLGIEVTEGFRIAYAVTFAACVVINSLIEARDE